MSILKNSVNAFLQGEDLVGGEEPLSRFFISCLLFFPNAALFFVHLYHLATTYLVIASTLLFAGIESAFEFWRKSDDDDE